MIESFSQPIAVKIHAPNFGLLVESSHYMHIRAAQQLAEQFCVGFDESFDERIKNLNQHRADDVNFDVFLEDAITREIKNVARQVVVANHVLFGFASHHRLPYTIAKQIGSSIYLASAGKHRIFVVDGDDESVLDVDAHINGLNMDAISDIKRKEQAMRTGDISVHRFSVDSDDCVVMLSEDASRHLSTQIIRSLMDRAETIDTFENELELHANVARRESEESSMNEIAALVMKIV